MARETVPPARSSRGKVTTRRTLPAVADGLGSALQTGSSATSTSTMATIQASFVNAVELFNSLLGQPKGREKCGSSCAHLVANFLSDEAQWASLPVVLLSRG